MLVKQNIIFCAIFFIMLPLRIAQIDHWNWHFVSNPKNKMKNMMLSAILLNVVAPVKFIKGTLTEGEGSVQLTSSN